MKIKTLLTALLISAIIPLSAHAQAQFKVPVTVLCDTASRTLELGVSGDGTGGIILDNTIGVDVDTSFGIWRELQLPPKPPAPYPLDVRFTTLPGRASAYPTGLGTGTNTDFRGFSDAAQVDSFRIEISGALIESNTVTIVWPSVINQYASQWVIKPLGGNAFPASDMLGVGQITINPQFLTEYQVVIIKTGAFGSGSGGSSPALNAAPNPLAFGNVLTGTKANMTLTLSNPSVGDTIRVDEIELPGGAFTIQNMPFLPVVIDPQDQLSFDVEFFPIDQIVYSRTLTIVHTGQGDTSFVELSGTGYNQGGPQGGTLAFAASERLRLDNTNGYIDSIGLYAYTGEPLKSLQFKIVNTNGKIRFRDLRRGSAIANPDAWLFPDAPLREGEMQSDGSRNDTFSVVILGLTEELEPGTYPNLFEIEYDVVNISTSAVPATAMKFMDVLGSTPFGEDALIIPGSPQVIYVENRIDKGDVNIDDRVNLNDIIDVVGHILGEGPLTPEGYSRGDIASWSAGDGSVNVRDLALIGTVILDGKYPDGKAIKRTLTNDNPPIELSKRNAVANDSVQLQFYIHPGGITVMMDNSISVKGMQLEFNGIESITGSVRGNELLDAPAVKIREHDRTTVALLYSASGNSIPAGSGNHLITIPCSWTVSHDEAGIEDIVIADNKNREINPRVAILNQTPPAVSIGEVPVAGGIALHQNFPNPFAASTTITYEVRDPGPVELAVFDSYGRRVRDLTVHAADAGIHSIDWNGNDDSGLQLPQGTYFCRITHSSGSITTKMNLIR